MVARDPDSEFLSYAYGVLSEGSASLHARRGFQFDTRDAAASAAIQSICAQSVLVAAEFGGMIYESEGRFGFSPPRKATQHSMKGVLEYNTVFGASVYMGMLPSPGVRMVGTYHTHGAYSKGYLDEAISPTDRVLAYKLGIAAYVGTPSGRVLQYDPRMTVIRAPNAFDFQVAKVPC